jgi:hypothetical protein
MTDITNDWCLEGTELFMGGINLVGWLSRFQAHTGSVTRYATFVRRLSEAAAPWEGESAGRTPT